MKKYKIRTKAFIHIHADGKTWQQEVTLEYESEGENPWDMYVKAYNQQKDANLSFGQMEIIDSETGENCDYSFEATKAYYNK